MSARTTAADGGVWKRKPRPLALRLCHRAKCNRRNAFDNLRPPGGGG
ncbi:hypothetical protein [Desulfonema ishimotonii]|nr:hypothetical protein [Desulfonema ishimotonii]